MGRIDLDSCTQWEGRLTLLRPAAPALAAGPVVSVPTLLVLLSSLVAWVPDVPDDPERVRGLKPDCLKNIVECGCLLGRNFVECG